MMLTAVETNTNNYIEHIENDNNWERLVNESFNHWHESSNAEKILEERILKKALGWENVQKSSINSILKKTFGNSKFVIESPSFQNYIVYRNHNDIGISNDFCNSIFRTILSTLPFETMLVKQKRLLSAYSINDQVFYGHVTLKYSDNAFECGEEALRSSSVHETNIREGVFITATSSNMKKNVSLIVIPSYTNNSFENGIPHITINSGAHEPYLMNIFAKKYADENTNISTVKVEAKSKDLITYDTFEFRPVSVIIVDIFCVC